MSETFTKKKTRIREQSLVTKLQLMHRGEQTASLNIGAIGNERFSPIALIEPMFVDCDAGGRAAISPQ